MINFISVETDFKEHIDILYKFLTLKKNQISHKVLPDYKTHCEFVKSHPYRKWILINENNKTIGIFYITFDNSIGINLKNPEINLYKYIIQKIHKKYKPLPSIKSIRNENFILSISPDNYLLKKALEEINMETNFDNFFN